MMVNKKNIYFPISSLGQGESELKDFIEVEYPSEFKDVYAPYYYILNENIILLSGQKTNITSGLGLWMFDKRTEEFTQLINSSYWNYFYQVDGGVLISASNVYTTYYFDEDTLILTKVSNVRTINSLSVAGGYLLCCGTYPEYSWYFFNSETKTLSDSLCAGRYNKAYQVDGGLLLYDDASSYNGLVYYDEVAKTCTKVYEMGYGFTYFRPITDGVVISAEYTYQYSGAVFFNTNTKTCVQITSVGARYIVTAEIGDDYLISTPYYSGGIWHFNTETNTFTQVYPDGDWDLTMVLDDCVLFSSSNSGSSGIICYDKSTNTATKIYDSGSNWIYKEQNRIFGVESSNYAILSSSYSNGLLCFNKESKTITVLDDSARFALTDVGNGCIAYGISSNYKVILVNYSDLSIETIKPSTTNSYLKYSETLNTDTGVFFTQQSSQQFYINKNTLEVTNISKSLNSFEYTKGYTFFNGSKYLIVPGKKFKPIWFDETTLTTDYFGPNNGWYSYKEVDNGTIFAMNSQSNHAASEGVYFYNKADGTLSKICDGRNFLDYVIEYDGCLLLSSGFIGYHVGSTTIFSTTSNGILKYDPTDNSFTLIYSRGNGYKTLLPDGNIVRDNLDYNSLGYGCNLNTLEPNNLISGDVVGDYIYCDGYGIQKISTGELYLLKDDYSMFTYDDLKEYGFETGETMLLYKKVGV